MRLPADLSSDDLVIEFTMLDHGYQLGDDDQHLEAWFLTLRARDHDAGRDLTLGHATVYRARHTRMDGSLFDVLDAADADLSAIGEHVALDGPQFRRHVLDGWEHPVDFLVVAAVELVPAARGRNLSHYLLARAIDRLREEAAFIVLTPAPFGGEDPASRRAAVAKLTEHWARLGFTSLTPDLMYVAVADLDDAEPLTDPRWPTP